MSHGLTRTGTVLLVVAVLLSGCTKKELTEEERAALAAKACYEALYTKGQPEAFLRGRMHYKDMPQSFREQLLAVLRQHLQQAQQQRQGVKGVDVVRAQPDSTLGLTQVFLQLTYGNGTHEEVVVAMVQATDGSWHMK